MDLQIFKFLVGDRVETTNVHHHTNLIKIGQSVAGKEVEGGGQETGVEERRGNGKRRTGQQRNECDSYILSLLLDDNRRIIVPLGRKFDISGFLFYENCK